MFPWVLARVNTKLEGWKENLISKAGKEITIKKVIQALPRYAMSIFKILVSICKSIEQKVANFWWKNFDSKAGIHRKKWDVLKKRKDEGGMGFRDLLSFNRAMLGKQAWCLAQTQTSLWGRTLKSLYFPKPGVLAGSKRNKTFMGMAKFIDWKGSNLRIYSVVWRNKG